MTSGKLVWNLPVRLFHWSLAGLVAFSLTTGIRGDIDEMEYHMYSGYLIMVLVIFRVLFGIFSSGYSAFSSFVRGPKTILAYIKQTAEPVPGHNPLGALSILAMLFLLGVQVGTGLFATDDILIEGPLYHLVSYEMSLELTGIHEINQRLIMGLIALHLLAIAYYAGVKKHPMVRPMLNGRKDLAAQDGEAGHQAILALVCLATAAAVTWLVVTVL